MTERASPPEFLNVKPLLNAQGVKPGGGGWSHTPPMPHLSQKPFPVSFLSLLYQYLIYVQSDIRLQTAVNEEAELHRVSAPKSGEW